MIFLADTICPHQVNVPLSMLKEREVEELQMKVQEGKKSFQNKKHKCWRNRHIEQHKPDPRSHLNKQPPGSNMIDTTKEKQELKRHPNKQPQDFTVKNTAEEKEELKRHLDREPQDSNMRDSAEETEKHLSNRQTEYSESKEPKREQGS